MSELDALDVDRSLVNGVAFDGELAKNEFVEFNESDLERESPLSFGVEGICKLLALLLSVNDARDLLTLNVKSMHDSWQ